MVTLWSEVITSNTAIYYKDHFPVIRRNDIFSLNESIVLEICLANNNVALPDLHR